MSEQQRNCKERRGGAEELQRTEASRNGSELRSKAGQGVATAWQGQVRRRHGTEEPSDGIAQLREGTEERRSAGYEQQRQGMAVKGAKRSGKATSAPRRKGKACQSIETAWQSQAQKWQRIAQQRTATASQGPAMLRNRNGMDKPRAATAQQGARIAWQPVTPTHIHQEITGG